MAWARVNERAVFGKVLRNVAVQSGADLDSLIVPAGFGSRFNLGDPLGGHGSATAYEELK